MIKLRRLTVPVSPVFQLFPLINCGGNPCQIEQAQQLIVAVLQFLGIFSGVVATGVVLWGAFQFITSAGDPAKAEGARKTIWSGLIGAIIVVVAYAVVRVVANTIWGGDVPSFPNAPL